MDTRNIISFFRRPEKLLFGVCSYLSQSFNLPSSVIRISFIVITFIFIPVGIILYIGLYLVVIQKMNRMKTFGLLGAVLGVPLSYYFQSDMVKNYNGGNGMVSYMRNFFKIAEEYNKFLGNGWDIVFNLFLSVIIFAIIGVVAGYLLDKRENK
jgi:phage shock protein PspC (stress-responsive transcriptional regulator)